MTIVGVVGDVKQGPLDAETIPLVYVPLAQEVPDAMRGVILPFYSEVNVVARAAGSIDGTISALRSSLRQSDPALPPAKTEAVGAIVSDSVQPQRFSMTVVATFAIVALLLAAIGIYGVLANVVHQQTREIGVRVALGATTHDLLWLVLRRALVMAAAGLAVGTAGALAVTRLMASLLYEISPSDGIAFLGSACLLATLAIAASLVPAWRATRVDPLVALRVD
jgi:ABC-type antimicrobial peptide transport system permease subunit